MDVNHAKLCQKVPIKIGIGMGTAIAIGFVSLIFFTLGGKPPIKKREKQSQWQWQCPCQFWLVLVGTIFQNGAAPSSSAPSSLFRSLHWQENLRKSVADNSRRFIVRRRKCSLRKFRFSYFFLYRFVIVLGSHG